MELTTNNNLSNEEDNKKRIIGDYIRVPIFDLEDGIKVSKIIAEVGGGRLDVESIAKSMSYSNTTVMHHINSAKHYQLVENDKGKVKITELGRGIVHPKSNEEYQESVSKAFFACSLYNKIYNRYIGKNLPSLDILANIFARDEGVSLKSKDRTVSNFIQSGIMAGLIERENGIYHCIEQIENGKMADTNLEILETESIESPIEKKEENIENKENTKKISPNINKIKISAEPFFELYINPDEKAFNALLQLLPYYKEVYCKKNDDSLQRIVS
jgi:hypothetical protein